MQYIKGEYRTRALQDPSSVARHHTKALCITCGLTCILQTVNGPRRYGNGQHVNGRCSIRSGLVTNARKEETLSLPSRQCRHNAQLISNATRPAHLVRFTHQHGLHTLKILNERKRGIHAKHKGRGGPSIAVERTRCHNSGARQSVCAGMPVAGSIM